PGRDRTVSGPKVREAAPRRDDRMYTKTKFIGAAAAAILVLALAAGCGGSGSNSRVAGAQKTNSPTLVGAGSPLVAPLIAGWQSPCAKAHGVTVTYGAIGSGGGIQQISARTVDFGASDAPLTGSPKANCQGCTMIPWALAATTVSYNFPGLSKPLYLTGP